MGDGGYSVRHFRVFIFVSLSLLVPLTSQAQAQNLLDLFKIGCSELGATEGYEWICKAGDLANNIDEVLQSLHEDFVGFGRELFERLDRRRPRYDG